MKRGFENENKNKIVLIAFDLFPHHFTWIFITKWLLYTDRPKWKLMQITFQGEQCLKMQNLYHWRFWHN
jgi:hypothetical protein